jgi:GTP-binding protein
MALIDDIKIRVKGGNGGDGAKSFHINYGSMKRTPDGGNGGSGGNVYFKSSHNLSDLNEFRFKKVIEAKNGERGAYKNLYGKRGEDVTVLVPLGTTIIDTLTNDVFEIIQDGQMVLVAHGGRKGLGNHDFKVDIKNFRPRREMGETGEEKELHLILNLIADIGFIGLPNAGKSSLLKALTNATPKIGNYPFTTLEPNLGTMDTTVLADIPGLVEGAHEGKGLGIQFLKHIQKTKMLMHCIDVTSEDVLSSYETVLSEFADYDPTLLSKKEIILLTKTDLADETLIKAQIKKLKKTKHDILTVSIYDEESLLKLRERLKEEVKKLKIVPVKQAVMPLSAKRRDIPDLANPELPLNDTIKSISETPPEVISMSEFLKTVPELSPRQSDEEELDS